MANKFWMPTGSMEKDPWNPSRLENEWDTVVFAERSDLTFFGSVEVDGEGGTEIDIKKPKAAGATRLEYTGPKPFEVTITILLVTEDHWKFYKNKLIPLVRPADWNVAKTPTAIQVIHPTLRAVNSTSLVIKTISLPKSKGEGAGKQMKEVVIKAIQFAPIEWKKDESKDKKKDDKVIRTQAAGVPGVLAVINAFASAVSTPSASPIRLTGGTDPKAVIENNRKLADSKQNQGH